MRTRLLIYAVFCLFLILSPLAAASEVEASGLPEMLADLGLRESTTPARELPGWEPPRKVLVNMAPGEQLEALRAVAPGVEIVAVDSPGAAAAQAGDAQALIGFCGEEIFQQAPELHWVQVYSAGVERCVAQPGMRSGGKLLTNGQRLASPTLADTSIALMMALARGLDVYHRNKLQRDWNRDIDMGAGELMELAGRTVLVVGLGGIGSQTAKRAHGLGMRVIATRNSRRAGPDYVDYVGLSDELLELAAQADVVINTVPLTDETRGMFDAAFFARMKPTAYFISVGRGASTVTADLVAALENGSIAGAGLDVTDPEPLPADHVLWTMPRVLITPHTAARSDRTYERVYLLVQENLRRYVAGEPMLSVVDIERGY